jgi:quinol monooxygenase YgiN
MNVVVLAHLTVHPDDIETAAAAAATVADKTRNESGCHLYAFGRDVNQPNTLRISEHWASVEQLRAHLVQPHVAEFVGVLRTLRIVETESKQFTISAIGEVGS